jgi:transcription elongation GreA/GreB family factor
MSIEKITMSDIKEMKQDLLALKVERLPANAKRFNSAEKYSDEYFASKRELSEILARVSEIEYRLKHITVI